MAVLRFFLALVVGAALLLGMTAALVARVADGPVGPLPGGAFRSGKLVDVVPEDWSFARDVQEVELQLLEPPRSRTTWIVVHQGRPYIPCGFLDVPYWKRWPYEAERDGRALLRFGGRIYSVQVERVRDVELQAELGRLAAAKYGFAGEGAPDPERVWFFALSPRSAQGS